MGACNGLGGGYVSMGCICVYIWNEQLVTEERQKRRNSLVKDQVGCVVAGETDVVYSEWDGLRKSFTIGNQLVAININ